MVGKHCKYSKYQNSCACYVHGALHDLLCCCRLMGPGRGQQTYQRHAGKEHMSVLATKKRLISKKHQLTELLAATSNKEPQETLTTSVFTIITACKFLGIVGYPPSFTIIMTLAWFQLGLM